MPVTVCLPSAGSSRGFCVERIRSNSFPRFSVGSGRPPVIAKQYFDQCAKILEFPSYNSRDELVLAGVELYRTLWDLISSNVIQKESAAWPEIERLRKTHDRIYNKYPLNNKPSGIKFNMASRPRFIGAITFCVLVYLPHSRTANATASELFSSCKGKQPKTLGYIRPEAVFH